MSGSKILIFLAMSASIAPSFSAPTYGDDFVQYDLHISRQPLSAALQEFAKQSGVQIIFFSKATDGFEALSIAGKYTAVDALQRLLNRSELTFHKLNERTFEVRRRAVVQDLKMIHTTSVLIENA